MFTLQARLVENAAQPQAPSDMLRAVANCSATLEHRGPSINTHVPTDRSGAGGAAGGPPGSEYQFVTNINPPPWTNIPFTPIPYPPPQEPSWPGGPFDGDPVDSPRREPTIIIEGDTYLGDVFVDNITVEGDIIFEGTPLRRTTHSFLTNLRWSETTSSLILTRRTFSFIGRARGRAISSTVIEGEECPAE